MDHVDIDDAGNCQLPDWLYREPGYAIVHPVDHDQFVHIAQDLLVISELTVKTAPAAERGVVYFIKKTLPEPFHYNPMMRKSWD